MKTTGRPVKIGIRQAKQVIAQQTVAGDVVNFFGDTNLRRQLFGKARPSAGRRIAIEKYLRFLHDRHRYADFKGMGVGNRVALSLELAALYVPLKGRRQLPDGETAARELRAAGRPLPEEDRAVLGERLSQPVPVGDVLQHHAGVVIVGDPGSGKTTFLKQLTVRVATGQYPEKRFPVVVPLSAYANAIVTHDRPLQDFIPAHFQGECGVDISAEFERALEKGVALVMLDGLDEVKETGLRQTVVRRAVDLFNLQRERGNKFVLTSRIIGYREVRPTADDLAECSLEDFNETDIEAFIRNWTLALETAAQGETAVAARDAERERAELLDAVHRSEGVRRLAANPLLLTILALMKREGVTLPERRAELYDTCVKTLISSWNRARGLGRPPSRDFDPVQTLKVIAPLALWMHETSPGVGLVRKQQLLDRLMQLFLLPRIHPRTPDDATPSEKADAETSAARFLDDLHEHTGVVLERAAGRYGFIHLTFEEYLAAVGLALRGQEGVGRIVEAIRPHLHEPAWREVILLTVGHLGLVQLREEAASALVDALLADDAPPAGAAIVLAGDAVRDVAPHGVSESCRIKTVRALRATLANDARVEPVVRAQAGVALGRLGDDRPGVVPHMLEDLAQMEFCYVPPGPFRMGEGGSLKRNESLNERGFWIARFPVTVAQFDLFVKDGAYGQAEWWEEAKAAGHWKNGKISGLGYSAQKRSYEQEWRDRPGDSGARFTAPNHPIVDVNWYEAQAFSRWLTNHLPPLTGSRVALPVETEWEKAARGGEKIPPEPIIRTAADGLIAPSGLDLVGNGQAGREYPWGGNLESNRANYGATGINSTSAVGCFPGGASPYGVEDLSGNVWEWCEDWHDATRSMRVLRGGSWINRDPENLSCGYRDYSQPGYRYGNYGFRCVWVGGSAR